MNAALPRKPLAAVGMALCAVLTLGACGQNGADKASGKGAGSEKITVAGNKGDLEVPLKPKRVAALDNTSFATLKAFGVKPVAVPKGLLPKQGFDDWKNDSSIVDVGSHREPKFEALNGAEPDLIIGGYRFGDHYDKLSKIAKTLDVSPSDKAKGGFVGSLRTQTETLGKVFGKEREAEMIVKDLDRAKGAAVEATKGKGQSVFLGVLSAGKIDNAASRIGALIAPLELKNILSAEGQDSTSVHNNSGLAPETVAQLNPDWMILMDRDAAVADKGQETVAAERAVKGQEAWEKTTFRKKDQVIYLAPDFYVTEGIQAYTRAFDQVAEAFASAG